MLKNCYYDDNDDNHLLHFTSDNPFILKGFCSQSDLPCDLPCNSFCFYNFASYNSQIHRNKNCQEVDFKEIKSNNCDTFLMCNGTKNSFLYIPNVLSMCQQCEPKSSQVNVHVTSSMVTTSTQFPTSSSSDLYNPTSSLEIIQTTSSASLSDTKHDLTSSIAVPTTTLDSTQVDLTNSVSVPTPTLDSTQVDLTSSLLQPTYSYGKEVKNNLIKQIGKNTNQDKSDSITDSDLFIPMVATGSVLVAASVVIGFIVYKMFCKNNSIIDSDIEME